MVFERSKLLKWMLARLRPREFDSNKQSTAELLAILLQNSPKNQQRLADMNGIDALLQASFGTRNYCEEKLEKISLRVRDTKRGAPL